MSISIRILFYCGFTLFLFSFPLPAWSLQPGNLIAPQSKNLPLHRIKLPKGFQIKIFAENVTNARQMAQGEKGTIFVGSRREGVVYALRDKDGDFRVDETILIGKNFNMPSGIAFRQGSLYVADVNRIFRYDRIEDHLRSPRPPFLLTDRLPDASHHGWKFIAFSPDGWLYVPVGGPCNVCLSKDVRYGTILKVNPRTGKETIFAAGIRNSVGFDWHPRTKELWFTDNGRDNLGDNLPPDELNRAEKQGLHFGFPYVYGNNIPDPDFGNLHQFRQFRKPAQKLGAHVASLGMIFYTGKMFPDQYRNQIFIAEHGSWNRSKKVGYRISLVRLEGNRVVSYQPFATGWMQNERVWGRPVALLQLRDGSLLISDDYAGVIYRVSYQPEN